LSFAQKVCANGSNSAKTQIGPDRSVFIARRCGPRSDGVFYLPFATKKNARSRRAPLTIDRIAILAEIGKMRIGFFEAGKTTGPKSLNGFEGVWDRPVCVSGTLGSTR